MIERTVTIRNRAGMHARPAALLVKTASGFASQIYLEKDNERVNGKSIMGVITLGATYNSQLVITHYQRLLNYIVPDFVHVLVDGRVERTGDKALALELEARGYDWITKPEAAPV